MQPRHFRFLLIAITCLLVGCKKKDDCADFICLNGGTCFEGECVCPEGYGGSDCSQSLFPSMSITKVVVTRFPPVRLSGEQWDSGNSFSSAPDLYIALKHKGSIVYAFPTDVTATENNTHYVFDIPTGAAVMYYPVETYKMALYDRDNYTDDLLGELSFSVVGHLSENTTFPFTLVLDDGGRVAFDLDLNVF